MSIKDRSTEYMYISARVRAIEAGMPGREMIGRMIGAQDKESAAAVAVESGILQSASQALNPDSLDTLLLGRLKDALDTVETDEGGRLITPIVRVTYDCANIKAALRCIPHGIDFSDLLFDVGSVPASRYGEMAEKGDFSELPKNLAAAAEKAKTDYATTCDPLKIDLPLDRACFADMLEAAQNTGDSFAVDFVKTKIDMTNLMMILRIVGMNGKSAATLLYDAIIDGGYIDAEDLRDLANAEGDVKELIPVLARARYPRISEAVTSGEDFESLCDSLIEEKLQESRYIPFGIPIVLAFLCKLEYEIKNIRIILAAKAAGLSPEKIAQRVRGSYV